MNSKAVRSFLTSFVRKKRVPGEPSARSDSTAASSSLSVFNGNTFDRINTIHNTHNINNINNTNNNNNDNHANDASNNNNNDNHANDASNVNNGNNVDDRNYVTSQDESHTEDEPEIPERQIATREYERDRTYCENFKAFLKLYWKSVIIVLWPLILLPLLLHQLPAIRCGFVVLLMAMYWVTEALPLSVTSLLPVVLFPTLGIVNSVDTCICYMNDTIMVFIGGMILAIAIEHSKLHMRIALGVMRLVGCSHNRLLGGLFIVIALLSMWVSNTATTAMMVPIIFAVLYELEKEGLGRVFHVQDPTDPESPRKPTQVTKGYLLGTAFASTFSGSTTLVGTGTNLTLKGVFESTFPDSPEGINFSSWLFWASPVAAIATFCTYIYILIAYFGFLRPNSRDARMAHIGKEGEAIANRVVQEKYNHLGSMTFHEKGVLALFAMCVFLWMFRRPGFTSGWADLVTAVEVRDSAPVILTTILMFVVPKDPAFINICSKDPTKRPYKSSEGLLTWKAIQKKMPWSLMFLLGGGFAISKGTNVSCLSRMIGQSMSPLRNLPPFLILCTLCLFVSTVTEITSNIGMANIILPVIAQISVAVEVDPLYLMIPTAIITAYAFRLPVGTPPNAIVTIAGDIPVKDLIIGGCGPACYGYFIVIAVFSTWGVYVFKINGFPDWARRNNQSSYSNNHC